MNEDHTNTDASQNDGPAPASSKPQQRRSIETQNAILKAVRSLVAEGRYDEATVAEITSRAGCSIGAFYGRFRDKDAALYMLYDIQCTSLEEKFDEILDDSANDHPDLSSKLWALCEATIDHTFAHADFVRAEGFLSSPKTSDQFLERARQLNAIARRVIKSIIAAHPNELTHDNPEAASLLTLSMIGGLPRDAVKAGTKVTDASSMSATDYKAEIFRAVCGYLGVIAAAKD